MIDQVTSRYDARDIASYDVCTQNKCIYLMVASIFPIQHLSPHVSVIIVIVVVVVIYLQPLKRATYAT
jgi:hypothetical protein